MNILDALAAIIIALVPFNWTVAVFLAWLAAKHPDLATLRSRAFTQIVLATCSTIGGFFGVIRFTGLHLDPVTMTVLLVALILLPSLPGVYWLVTYLRDDFA